MFDSPMEYCPRCGKMVTLAQTVAECERKQGCGMGQTCPLRKYFSGSDGGPDPQPENPPAS